MSRVCSEYYRHALTSILCVAVSAGGLSGCVFVPNGNFPNRETGAGGLIPVSPFVLFGTTGAAGATGSAESDDGYKMKIDSSGRIVIVGSSSNTAGGTELVIWRYNSGGTLDTTFGGSGIVSFGATGAAGGTGSSESDLPDDFQFDAFGNIVIVGTSGNTSGGSELAIWRYLASGSPDTSFGGGGGYVVDGTTGIAGGVGSTEWDEGQSLAIDTSSGNLVISGYSRNSSTGTELAIWRYGSGGAADSSFNTNGYILYGPTGAAGATSSLESDRGKSILIDGSGNYVVAGYSRDSTGGTELAIWRYTSSGTLDTTFGSSGIAISGATSAAGGSGTNDSEFANSMRLDGSGNLVLAGLSKNAVGGSEVAIWRYTANGSLDTTFGSGGYATFGSTGAAGGAGSGEFDQAIDLTFDSSGNLVLGGYSKNPSSGDELAVWRYLANGSLDPSFGTGGSIISGNVSAGGATGAAEYDSCEAIAIEASGDIVCSGLSKTSLGGTELALWRFLPSGASVY